MATNKYSLVIIFCNLKIRTTNSSNEDANATFHSHEYGALKKQLDQSFIASDAAHDQLVTQSAPGTAADAAIQQQDESGGGTHFTELAPERHRWLAVLDRSQLIRPKVIDHPDVEQGAEDASAAR